MRGYTNRKQHDKHYMPKLIDWTHIPPADQSTDLNVVEYKGNEQYELLELVPNFESIDGTLYYKFFVSVTLTDFITAYKIKSILRRTTAFKIWVNEKPYFPDKMDHKTALELLPMVKMAIDIMFDDLERIQAKNPQLNWLRFDPFTNEDLYQTLIRSGIKQRPELN